VNYDSKEVAYVCAVAYWTANVCLLLLIIRRSRRSERRILLKFFIREQSTPHLSVDATAQLHSLRVSEAVLGHFSLENSLCLL